MNDRLFQTGAAAPSGVPRPGSADLPRALTDYNRDLCIHELFELQAEHNPDAVAIVSGDRTLTYDQLNLRANRLAHQLRSLGVLPDSLVGICLERSPEMVIGLLGILKAGGAYVPLDSTYPRERLHFMAQDAALRIVVTGREMRGALPEKIQPVFVEADPAGPERNPVPAAKATNLAYVLYTSGSTGRPKGVCVEHRSVNRLVKATNYASFDPSEVFLQMAPLAFDASTFEIWGPLLNGGRLVLMPPGQPTLEEIGRAIGEHHVTTLWLTAGLFQLMVAERLADLRPLHQLLAGGDVLSVNAVERARRELSGCRLINGYGPTEGTTFTCCYTVPDGRLGTSVPIGRPIANTTVFILDEDLKPVPEGAAGELFIGGDGVARGYLNQPELTAEKFLHSPFSKEDTDRLYRTGDRARYLPDGNIEFLGRLDQQVKIRGFRIEPGEIETVLGEHPSVRQAAVVPRPDNTGEPLLVAYVVTVESITPHHLRQYLRGRLPEYMVPAAFVFLESLPLTPNSKLDRNALPAPETIPNTGIHENLSPEEARLAAVWNEILGFSPSRSTDNFFDLGGHSLKALRLAARIKAQWGIDLTLRDVFSFASLDAMTRRIQQQRGETAALALPAVVRDDEQHADASFSQQRMWFLQHRKKEAYNEPFAVRLTGPLQVEALRQSLQALEERHEVLRTTFSLNGEHLVQHIRPAAVVSLPVEDLSGIPAAERESHWQALASSEALKPFDLERGPVWRCRLFRLDEQEYALCLTFHHICLDEWSLGILWNELQQFYGAFRQGTPLSLDALPCRYADYARWQRQWLAGGLAEAQLDYWRRQLGGTLPVLELPCDRPRTSAADIRGAIAQAIFSRALPARLESLGKDQNATLFMTLLGAFQALLSRYSGQKDIVIGTPIINRNLPEFQAIAGLFLNTLVIRGDLSGKPTIREWIARIRDVSLDAYANQDVPFEEVVHLLRREQPGAESPFRVMFVLQDLDIRNSNLDGLHVRTVRVDSRAAKFDLTLFMEVKPEGLEAVFEYSTDLFEAETIQRMLGHLEVLLDGMASHPDRAIGELPILTPQESRQILVEWNQTATDYPRQRCIHELFEQQVELTPDAVAVVAGERELSYRKINRRANRLANRLQKSGVGAETLVGVCLERSPEMVIALLAILKAGGAYVPLDPAYPQERIDFMLRDGSIHTVITSLEYRRLIPEGVVPVLPVSESVPSGAEPEIERNLGSVSGPESLAYVIYTSGSTGQPKGVCVAHRAVARLVKGTGYASFDAGEVFLQMAPLAFDASTFEIWGALLNGARLVFMPPGRPTLEEIGQAIRGNHVTTLWLTAGLFQLMVAERLEDLRSLRQLLAGGDVLSPQSVDQARRELKNCRLINGYGPTEGTTFSCCYTIPSAEAVTSVPIGRPIANTTVFILDEDLQPVPVGVAGELFIGGDGLARGYLNRPELTAEKFILSPFGRHAGERLYRTGDRAKYLPTGNIAFLGRLDHQVKIRGFRIEPAEIETVLRGHRSVRDCAVIATEGGATEKSLVAYLVADTEQDPASTAAFTNEIRNWLQGKLPEYMVPAQFILIAHLPLTANGKVDRRALPLPTAANTEPPRKFVEFRDPLEHELAQIWQETLGLNRIAVNDNFFDLGGQSMSALTLFSRIERRYGQKLPLASLLQAPTVRQLAEILRQGGWKAPWSPLVPLQPKGNRLPLYIVSPGSVLFLEKLAHCIGEDQPVYGLQAPGLNEAEPQYRSAETLAAGYLDELRAFQPTGPYLLAGRCFGAFVALEMAQQLESQGEEVRLLAIIDSGPPRIEKNHLADSRTTLSNHAPANPPAQPLRFPRKVLRTTRRWRDKAAATLGDWRVSLFGSTGERQLKRLEQQNKRAAQDYVGSVYRGVITLIRSQEFSSLERKRFHLDWSDLAAGGLHSYVVSGTHVSMFEEPDVRSLARQLRRSLEASQLYR